jgi:hypothetical protein
VYPSVTEILKVTGFGKHQLMYWAAKTSASLVLSDPETFDTAEKAASGIYQVRDKAATRGSMVHSLAEAMDKGGEILPDLLPDVSRGYAHAYKAWFDDTKPAILYTEATVWNDTHGYAGTMDLLATMQDGGVTLIDRKTGKSIYLEAWLQLSAYKHAEWVWPQGEKDPIKMPPVETVSTLLLSPDGSYDFKTITTDFPAFLAAKTLWEWAEKRNA